MSVNDEDSGNRFSLIMPFVVCVSSGGPYEDSAYAAGWEMGKLDVMLSIAATDRISMTVRRFNLPQADLVAMGNNWVMKEKDVPQGLSSLEADSYLEWACVTFERIKEQSHGMTG